MKTQHQQLIDLHSDGNWICSTAVEYMRDARKRISELNHLGYKFEAKPCDGRCGKTHNSRLFMRRLVSVPQGNIQPVKQILDPSVCCISFKILGFHSRDCVKITQPLKVENSLF